MSRVSRSLCLALATTALTVSAPAFAEHHVSPKPAPVSELVDAVDIPYERFTLDNGLKVLIHTDRKAPIVAVSIWYAVGSANEPKGKTGYAHLFEHIMFNGSENAPGDYFGPLRQIGATD
jgi:predicted Zn-dependent peptidase